MLIKRCPNSLGTNLNVANKTGSFLLMRNAWLIIAHNEFEVLQRLVSLLDDERSDFFIHFDKKVKEVPTISVKRGRLFVLDNRVDVRWGSVSQIETELVLLEAALKHGPYVHYHILSGTHLPLKPVTELLTFYDSHAGEEIMRFWPDDKGDADFKLRRYHFPLRDYKSPDATRRRLCQLAWQIVIKIQKVLGIRHLEEYKFCKTDNWISLSESACHYLVSHKDKILQRYRWSFCGDEYFAASELKSSPTAFKILDCQQLLYVEFQKDTPRTFPLADYPKLQETGRWWARKFTAQS